MTTRMSWPAEAGEMAARIRAHDWAATPLGPVEGWPERLKAIVELVLASSLVSTVALGDGRLLIYNDAAARLYGSRHPRALGRPLAETFADSYPTVASLYDRVFAGETVAVRAQPLAVGTTDDVEVFDANLTPVRDAGGIVVGAHMVGLETGGKVRAEAALRESQEVYRTLVETIDDGFCTVEVLFDSGGRPYDYRFIQVNPAFERQTGLAGATGRTARELVPDHPPQWFEIFGRIVRSGIRERFEEEQEALGRWYEAYAVPVGKPGENRLAVLFRNILPRLRAQAALHESEARLRALVLAGAQMIYRMSPDWTLMHQLAGLDILADTTAPSENWSDTYLLAQDRRMIFAAVEEAIRTKSRFDLEHRVRTADGGVGWVHSRAVPILGPGGDIVEWFGVGVDIEARKRIEAALHASEERQAFLLGLSDALRPLAEPGEIRDAASRLLREYLKLDRCGYAEIHPDDETATISRDVHGPGVASFAGIYRLDAFGPSVLGTMRRGDTLSVDDVEEDPVHGDPLVAMSYAAKDVRAFVAAPLVKDDRLVAILFAHHRTPRRWTSSDVAVVEDVAERTWAAVARARAEAALRESEARYRIALRVGRIGSWETDFTAGVRRWSPEAMDLFGLDLPDGKGQVGGQADEWQAALHPDERGRDLSSQISGSLAAQDRLRVEYRIVRPDGRVVWLRGDAEVGARDEFGTPTRLVNVAADVTEGRVAAQALRESEERFRSFAEHSADTLWILDVESRRFAYLSPAFETMWGERRERVMADLGRWAELVHPDDRDRASGGLPRLLAGEFHQQEYRVVRASDGAVRWIQDTGFPIPDETGRVRRVAGIAQDVTERRASESAVRASRRRLRSLVEGIAQLVWRAVDGGEWTWVSPQWTRFTGLSEAESVGWGWLDALHEDDRQQAREAWSRAEAEGGFEVEYRLRHAADGQHRWFQTRATPVRDEDGVIVEWLGTSTDIDELRVLHEHQKLLLGELQHRVRNTLSVIRSIARRTANTSETVEDYAAHLDGRLGAFARTQAAVTRDPASGISLGSLIAEELAAYGAREGRGQGNGQVRIDGPELRLTPKAAETLGLAVHELATNAVKYGALAPGLGGGRVRVEWRLAASPDAPTLMLEWAETVPQGTALSPPTRRGFGTELLERTLQYELKARTKLDFTPTGLQARIELPLGDRLVWKGPTT